MDEEFTGKVYLYSSAVATYFSPSDVSGIGGMLRERIRSMNKWRNDHERRDCVFVEHDADIAGFRGMFAAQVYAFVKFKYNSITYPCALVKFFSTIGDSPCPNTGMWMVRRDDEYDLVHIDAIVRAAHLIGIAGDSAIPHGLLPSDTIDVFKTFYVNKFIDYHAFELAF